MKRLLQAAAFAAVGLLASCGTEYAAFAGNCRILPNAAGFDWSSAQHYDSRQARELMQQILVPIEDGPQVDASTIEVPATDDLYALPVGNQVLIIRIRGQMLCPDPPIDRDVYEAARRKVIGPNA